MKTVCLGAVTSFSNVKTSCQMAVGAVKSKFTVCESMCNADMSFLITIIFCSDDCVSGRCDKFMKCKAKLPNGSWCSEK